MAAGIAATHVAPTFDAQLTHIMPQIASMGAAVAIGDFDRDGWEDFYSTNSGEASLNHLYRNQHDGTFKDVAAEMGVADVNRPVPAFRWEPSGVTMTTMVTRICFSSSTAARSSFTTSADNGSRLSAIGRACPTGSMRIVPSGSISIATGCSTCSLEDIGLTKSIYGT
jgi:hypothetical protein